jgi:hypothetical protein
VLAVFAWALLGFGNIYYGLARRAYDVTLQSIKSKRSIALSRSMGRGWVRDLPAQRLRADLP